MLIEKQIYQLNLLKSLLNKLSEEQYSTNIIHLGNSSIGGHTRHVIELLQCTLNGYKNGMVDYYNRERNLELETSRTYAQQAISILIDKLELPDKQLSIVFDEDIKSQITSTYYRELVYNTEHAIHHFALIKVALIEHNLNVVSEDFGMAYSTLKYKSSLATANS